MLIRYVLVVLVVYGIKIVNCKQKLESEMIVILSGIMGQIRRSMDFGKEFVEDSLKDIFCMRY